jgi:hypothetical protein
MSSRARLRRFRELNQIQPQHRDINHYEQDERHYFYLGIQRRFAMAKNVVGVIAVHAPAFVRCSRAGNGLAVTMVTQSKQATALFKLGH